MQRIVNEVLDFAKPLQLDLKESDIGGTVNRAVAACRAKSMERGASLTANLPAESITIAMDSFHVERALVNLIDNAVDASHRGGQVIVTSVADGNGLTVTIKDNGAGMDSETQSHLFEPFYTTKDGGTGLGMPIAKENPRRTWRHPNDLGEYRGLVCRQKCGCREAEEHQQT